MSDHTVEKVEASTRSQQRGYTASVIVLGVLAAIFSNLCFSNEYACTIVFMGILALLATPLLALCLPRIRATRRWIPYSIAIAIGATAGMALRVNPNWAFEESFGFEMPPEIKDFRVLSRHYEGGGGDHSMFMEFHGPRPLVESLAQRAGLGEDSEDIQRWRDQGGGWDRIADCFYLRMTSTRRRSWESLAPMEAPRLFIGVSIGQSSSTTLMIYDESTERVVVISFR